MEFAADIGMLAAMLGVAGVAIYFLIRLHRE